MTEFIYYGAETLEQADARLAHEELQRCLDDFASGTGYEFDVNEIDLSSDRTTPDPMYQLEMATAMGIDPEIDLMKTN